MAIRVRVQNDLQIIVPVRIERAVTSSPPVLDAPDPDDRGWVNNRTAGLNVNAKVRGALFGMTIGDTVKLKIVRQDLDASVPLFVTAEGGQVQIHKDSRGKLLGDSTFKVHAAQDSSSPTTIQVRLGSPTGAVICEADAHVFSPLTLNITPHVCTVSSTSTPGVAPTVNGAAVDATMISSIFAMASAIWRPAGINFNVGAVLPEAFTFAQPNVVALGERGAVLGQNQKAGTCNLYFLVAMAASTPGRITFGLGIRKETQSGTVTNSGILIGTANRSSAGAALLQELGNDVAHEVGHFLTLSHANLVNGAGEPDTYNRRMLMHPSNLLTKAASPLTATSVPRFNDIGYGSGGGGSAHRGCLVTLKDHPQHQTDGEVMAARNRFKSVNLYA